MVEEEEKERKFLRLSADEKEEREALKNLHDGNENGQITPFDISNPDNEFHALYWPMDKWIDDSSVADMINTMICAYPELKWSNTPQTQFSAMLSVFHNSDWVNGLITHYDYTMVDFMRLMLANWPDIFAKKRYASALSTTVVSCLLRNDVE